MSTHPFNLAVRFLLELAILFSVGYWAWKTQQGWLRYVLMAGLPLVAAAAWGIFRVLADHGHGLVEVPGILRLVLELLLFSAAGWCLKSAGQPGWATIFILISVVHYAVSYDRILLLLKN
jgi:hypothetical protein